MTAPSLAETLERFVSEAAPGWGVHRFFGKRRIEWGVPVTANRRINFAARYGGISILNPQHRR